MICTKFKIMCMYADSSVSEAETPRATPSRFKTCFKVLSVEDTRKTYQFLCIMQARSFRNFNNSELREPPAINMCLRFENWILQRILEHIQHGFVSGTSIRAIQSTSPSESNSDVGLEASMLI